MTISPTSAYENISIYNIIIVVNLLYVSLTFCDHLQAGVFFRNICYKDKQANEQIENIKF